MRGLFYLKRFKMNLIEKSVGYVIEIERIVPMMKMPKIMGEDYKAIFKYFSENGIKPSEKTLPYTRYVNINWESQMKKGALANFIDVFTKKWHFYDGVQSPKKLADKGEFVSRRFIKRQYLRAMHYGPYQKVSETYKKMWQFAQENKLKLENESIEFYLNDPKTVKKEEIETEILIPIKK
jgi:effector-binding domain-containing protein